MLRPKQAGSEMWQFRDNTFDAQDNNDKHRELNGNIRENYYLTDHDGDRIGGRNEYQPIAQHDADPGR